MSPVRSRSPAPSFQSHLENPPRLRAKVCQSPAYYASRPSDQNLLVRFSVGFARDNVGRDVLHKITPPLRAFAFNHPHAPGRHVAGFEAEDAAVAHLNVRPKPIGAEHSPGGIKGHRGCDRTFEFLSGAG